MTDATLLPSPEDKPLNMIAGAPAIDVLDLPDKARILIYGTTGAGKTDLAASAALVPEMCPVLFIDIGGGMRTVKSRYPSQPIKVVKPQGKNGAEQWVHFNKMYDALQLKGGGGYKTIVVDLTSEAYNLCMEWWLTLEKAKDPNRDIDLPGAAGGKDDFGRDWNKVRSVMRKMVRGFTGIGTHVIFTAHDKDEESRTSSLTMNVPAFPGQAVKDLLGFVDEVYYLYTKDGTERDPDTRLPVVERRIQCQPTNVRPMCKSRGLLPMVVVNPTIGEIVKLAKINLDGGN